MTQFCNTLSGKAEAFEPLQPPKVGMYTCGPTVYDYAHIGNFRAFVFEDLLRRFLEFKGFQVKHVMNLTDVDDKTIAGAQREKLKLNDYTAKYIQAFNEDLKTLNCLRPEAQPRATEKIPQMLELIQKLVKKEAAYEKDGSVYYRVSKFSGYGKLSKKKLEMNIAGGSERVDSDEYESKEQVSDFVLWKASKPGEAELGAAWDSPWGKGRPGWHIECSAMSIEALGSSFDIHAGGEDLIFPHHENEIAQSEGATGIEPFVKYWLHCKFLLVDGEKMSKSKGNFYTLRDLLIKGHDPMAIRFALLSTHYRSTLNFSEALLKESSDSIKKLDDCYWQIVSRKHFFDLSSARADLGDIPKQILDHMAKSLSDDLNIAPCVSSLLSGLTQINTQCSKMASVEIDSVLGFFKGVDILLGLDIADFSEIPLEIKNLLQKRSEVRSRINEDKSLWKVSDQLRDEIQSKGWLVKDGKPGEPSTVKMKRRVWDK